jgi:serine/threonine-protein kinase Chk2
LPYLELRFSDGPRSSTGFVFGKDPDRTDIVLPNIRGISRQHFALTFRNDFSDKQYRLVVRDLGSIEGTMVTYDGHGDRVRSRLDWIVAGFGVPDECADLIIQPSPECRFQLVVAPRNIASSEYITNVERFLRGAADSDTLFSALRLQSGPHTERNTVAHTPGNRPILIHRGVIGKGKFGVVTRYWNVSTGDDYARKTPADDGYKKHRWEREIAIMQSVQHVRTWLYSVNWYPA